LSDNNVALQADIDSPEGHTGLVGYYPVPSTATLTCTIDGHDGQPLIAPVQLSNLYLDPHFVDPRRDFLSVPADTLTFNEGFITGHKYTDQSPTKTVVDTVTGPIRAVLPSVSVQQTTNLQTGGGKPDQLTTGTQTTTKAQ